MGNEVAVWDESTGTVPYVESLARGNLADVTIQCEGREFPVHSLVLECISPLFSSMMRTDVKEGRIRIEDVRPEVLEEMLELVYTGDFKTGSPLPDGLLIELLCCAGKSQFAALKNEIWTRMQSQLSVNNAVKYVQAANTYGAGQEVRNDMLQFCKRNLSLFQKHAEFKAFFRENMDDLI